MGSHPSKSKKDKRHAADHILDGGGDRKHIESAKQVKSGREKEERREKEPKKVKEEKREAEEESSEEEGRSMPFSKKQNAAAKKKLQHQMYLVSVDFFF